MAFNEPFFKENSVTEHIYVGISYAEQEKHTNFSTSGVAPIYVGISRVRPYYTEKKLKKKSSMKYEEYEFTC